MEDLPPAGGGVEPGLWVPLTVGVGEALIFHSQVVYLVSIVVNSNDITYSLYQFNLLPPQVLPHLYFP